MTFIYLGLLIAIVVAIALRLTGGTDQ